MKLARLVSVGNCGLLILCVFAINVFAVNAFVDVSSNHEYKTGIKYLKDRAIVEGYQDGTFKSSNTINRAEMTKILLVSNKIPIQEFNSRCFKDVPINDWYSNYICTAKSLGWVEGYKDGTFRFANSITRAEALTIIGRAEGWAISDPILSPYSDVPLKDWYTNNVYYAKNKNYLPFVGAFSPVSSMNRGEFAEIYYRILYTEENKLSEFEVEDNKLLPGVEFFAKNIFSNIILDSQFPKTFLRNESFTFSGKVQNKDIQELVFIVFDNSNVQIDNFVVKIKDGKFEFGHKFDTLGSYNIALSDGNVGQSQLAKIEVVDVVIDPMVTGTFDSKNFSQNLSFDGVYTSLDVVSDADLLKVDLIQGADAVTYFSRLENGSLFFNYNDFRDFGVGKVEVVIQAADFIEAAKIGNFAEVSRRTYNVVMHQKSEVTNGVKVDNLPIFHSGKIVLTGIANTTLNSSLYLINPDGTVTEFKYESKELNQGSKFNYSLSLPENGTYIVELNNDQGIAVINHPVYRTNYFPLIPDYFDLNSAKLNKFLVIDEDAEVDNLLNYINKDRKKVGLKKVVLDADLSSLAEYHIADMINNNYFSHTNLRGESPQDRAVNLGIDTVVAENIAKVVNTEFGHNALMRSAIHRQNILNTSWTLVGLSVKKNLQGYYYLSQQFSTSRSDFIKLVKNSLIQKVPNLFLNKDLSERADIWNQKMIGENEFSTNIGGENIFDSLSSSVGVTSVQALILNGTDPSEMVELLLDNSKVSVGGWTDYGVSIDFKDDGQVAIVFIWGK